MSSRPEPSRGFVRPLDFFNRIEFPVLLAVILIAGGLYAFIELSEVARDTAANSFDTRILLAFREQGQPDNPIGSANFESMVRDITALGGTAVLVLLTALVILYLFIADKWQIGLFVLAAVSGGQIVSTLLKLGIDRPRPDIVSHLMEETSRSFPSGHAMMSAVTYLTLGSLLARIVKQRRQKVFFLFVAVLLTLMIGASRVYLGVHWPTDVLAGWCAGSIWAMLCWLIARWWLKNRDTPP